MMDDESRIMALVESILDSDVTPEEACRERPDLLPAVRRRLEQFRSVDAHLFDVFPPHEKSDEMAMHFRRSPRALPAIPGYEVEKTIGTGGVGVVYRARHIRLNRVVAIKMLLAGGYAGDREIERFKREAQAVAALKHPNIVQVYDTAEHDGFPYLVMEFMEGGTLNCILKGVLKMARKAAETATTLARAVHAAHLAGIVHRDLKPGNVLLTADGTPKIADFGLARRLDRTAEATVTHAGARIGTPSYMSPEQAAGREEVGAPSDIYSLGAILYEMLTGRPPFRGESAAETERQVINDEPVRPSLLNPRTPRDLETICLKCLQKSPAQRYPTALEVADDLDRFVRGEPIKARRVSPIERAGRWMRRKPAAAALIIVAALLATGALALGLGAWQGAAKRRVEIAAWAPRLELVRRFEREGKLQEARTILPRPMDVETREIRTQVQAAMTELELAQRLETVRSNRQEIVNGRFDDPINRERADKRYEEVFQRAGFGDVAENPEVVAGRIAQSPVRTALVAAMDDWSSCTSDDARCDWIMEVARRADPKSTGWRDRARRTHLSPEALKDLVATVVVQDQSPQLLVAFGDRLRRADVDAVPFLDQVQKQDPGDFWACFTLGTAVLDKLPAEGIRYYQAALASHPESALAHEAVGRALSNLERHDEAIPHFREALRLEPTFGEAMGDLGWALERRGDSAEGLKFAQDGVTHDGSAKNHHTLGAILELQGKFEEAVAEFRRSVEIDPKYGWGYLNLAGLFESTGRTDEAMAELERCLRVNPEFGWGHVAAAEHLKRHGRIDDAMKELTIATGMDSPLHRASAHNALADCWRARNSPDLALAEYNQALLLNPKDPFALRGRREVMAQLGLGRAALVEWTRILDANPDPHEYWDGYAELCMYVGDQGAYEDACHRLLKRYGSTKDPRRCEHVGRACLLGIAAAPDAARAQALVERAMQAELPASDDWVRPYFLVAQGLARYRANDFDGAVASIGADSQNVLGPMPHLVLAMAQQRSGHRPEALQSFTHAILIFDWNPTRAGGPDAWMYHVLRREVERVVIPNLEALLSGQEAPRDQDERLAVAAVCQTTGRWLRAAALYAEAIDAEPDEASRPESERRYMAACCAVRAACGVDPSSAALSAEERGRLRGQARRWLRADLQSLSEGCAAGTRARHFAAGVLARWQADPDLASVRDKDSMASIPEGERDEWRALWSEVEEILAKLKDAQ
jgi:serine/threonine-protein kinase